MGIIREILSEEVINSKGWVELIRYIEADGYGDLLVPHEVIGNRYIKFDDDRYVYSRRVNVFDHKYVIGGNEDTPIRLRNLLWLLNGKKYMMLTDENRVHLYLDGETGFYYVWFDFTYKLSGRVLGQGANKTSYDYGDKIMKDGYVATLDSFLPYLSKHYPDYFVRTTVGKGGQYFQPKVKLITDENGDLIEGYENDYEELCMNAGSIVSHLFDQYFDGEADEEFAKLCVGIRQPIEIDDGYFNCGIDNDGKLKFFDI